MFESVTVIGAGRVGSAISARLRERGLDVRDAGGDLFVLCVPDSAIPEVAAAVEPGPWIAHVSGATPLSALEPHVRRFSMHPLQTFTRSRGAEQLDGAYAAVTAETDEALEHALWLARTLGLEPFELEDDARPLYHAGAAIAASYLVTLYRVASELVRAAGAPPESLVPLMRRTIENRFELTGPIERGDWATVEAHRRAIAEAFPGVLPLYDVLGAATRDALGTASDPGRTTAVENGGGPGTKVVRTKAELRRAVAQVPTGAEVGLVPTMGAFHEGHFSLFRAARRECDVVVVSLFVNPAQFGPGEDLDLYPRNERADVQSAEAAGVDILFAPSAEEMYDSRHQTWVEVEELGSALEGAHRPAHFRGVATVCLKLFNLVRPRRAYFGQKDAQQAAVVRQLVRDLDLGLEIRVLPTVRDPDGLALSSRNRLLTPDEREAARALPRALATKDPERARALLAGLDVDYVEVADFEPPVLAAAVRVGSTRLIDNVPLDGDSA